ISDYNQALSLDPKHAVSYYNRGLAWDRKGDNDRAVADYNEAISLDPNNVEFAAAYAGRGMASADKGDNARALADFDKGISLDPKNADAYFDRGIVSFYSGALAEARADFEQAATLKPDFAYSAIWLDLANRRAGLGSHLQGWIGKVDMTKWPAPVARMLLGKQTPADTLKAADDPDATTKTGQVCEANFYTAELSRLQGQNDEALQLYRAAVSGCPKGFYEYQAAKAALRELGVSL
ncbi:MAG: tetratricopeptide repeat protein, partial [Mesorhizobium sp.]